MFFFSLFSEAFRLLQSGFDFYVHSRLPLRKSRQGIWTEFLQLRYGAYTTFERLKIGKATEKLCSNSVAVLECFSVYNPQIEMFARFKTKSSFHKTKRII